MKTDITYDQLRPHLCNETRLWIEDDATKHTEGHETPYNAWYRIFGDTRLSEGEAALSYDFGDSGVRVYPNGRVHCWAFDSDEIYQLPEAAMRELGLIEDDTISHAAMAEQLRADADGITSHSCPETLSDFLEMADRLPVSPLRDACLALLEHPDFFTWPAAISHHHAYEEGLLTHTLEVADIALHIAAKFPGVNKDVLIAAALWHDYGKLFEYRIQTFNGSHEAPESGLCRNSSMTSADYWVRDPKAVHHCISSASEFIVAARANGVDRATEDAVVHCILSHHGPVKEWGSPVAPESLEAVILSQADYLSAKAGATK